MCNFSSQTPKFNPLQPFDTCAIRHGCHGIRTATERSRRWLLVTFCGGVVRGGWGSRDVENWEHGKWVESDNGSVQMTDSCFNARLWTMQITREAEKVRNASSLCRQEVVSGHNRISHMRRIRATGMPSVLGKSTCLIRHLHQALQSRDSLK